MPKMPPWPKKRLAVARAFSYTGLDYLGPLYIKRDSELSKVWICLFTCLTVRAIHLELVHDLTAQEFLMALRRFIARRGTPIEITLDNAPQFKASKNFVDRLWKDLIVDDSVHHYVSKEGITWRFLPEFCPWMGGFYERLVGLVKRTLRKSIGKICLNSSQLETIVTEIEAILNTRPLVYVGAEIESGIALTPANFLTMNTNIAVPSLEPVEDEDFSTQISTSENLVQIWQKGENYLRTFWKLWQNEYLLNLRERFQTNLKSSYIQAKSEPFIGEVVLIKENLPRCSWKLGQIKELNNSSDGNIRTAKVRMPNGRVLCRPLCYLFPLECGTIKETEDTNVHNEVKYAEMKERSNDRKRSAALVARKRIQAHLNAESDGE